MVIDSVASLVDTIRQGGFLDPSRLEELHQDLLPAFPDVRALARELVKRDWLTPFQINHLIQGRIQELVLGPYLLLERLGTSATGSTFKALHRPEQRVVALKIINKELLGDADNLRRYQEGIRAAARLSHVHLATVHEPQQTEGKHFFTRPWVEGIDLSRLVAQRVPLPVVVAADYVRQAALGLQHIHEHGLTHPPLQPGSLLLAEPEGIIKLLGAGQGDLGLPAKGQPAHLVSGQDAGFSGTDVRANLFPLGSILSFLLTGKSVAGPDLPELSPEVPPGLADVLRKLMAPVGANGYETPGEAADALEPFARPAAAAPLGGAVAVVDAGLTPPPGETAIEPEAPPAVVLAKAGITPPTAVPVTPRSSGWLQAKSRDWRWLVGAAAVLALLVAGSWYWASLAASSADTAADKARQPEREEAAAPRWGLQTVLGSLNGRHWGPVSCVAWSPHDPLLVSGGEDHVVRFWDAKTLQPRGVGPDQQAQVNCLAFSPSGQRLLSGAANGSLWLWNVRKQQYIADFAGDDNAIRAVAFSPNGQQAVSAAASTVTLWKVSTRRMIKFNRPGGQVLSLAFGPDGTQVVAGTDNGTAYLWDLKGEGANVSLGKATGAVTGVAFAPRGGTILVGTAVGSLRLWKASPQPKVLRNFEGFQGPVTSVAWSPRGDRVLATGADGTIRIWDADSATLLQTLKAAEGPVGAAVFSPDGRRVCSGGQDVLVRLWDWKTGTELVEHPGHAVGVQSVALSAGGRQVLSASADNHIILWDRDRQRPVWDEPGSPTGVPMIAFTPDGKEALAVLGDGKARVLNTATGGIRRNLAWKVDPLSLSVAFTPDGDRVVTSDSSNPGGLGPYATVLHDTGKHASIRPLAGHFRSVLCTTVSPDGTWALAGGHDSKLRLVDLAKGRELRRLAGHTLEVLAVAFEPAGHSAVSVAADRSVWWWNLDRDEDRQLPDLPERAEYRPTAAAVAPGGKVVAYGGPDGRLVLCETQTGQKITQFAIGGPVTRVVFSPDGNYLASAKGNGTISVYRRAGAP